MYHVYLKIILNIGIGENIKQATIYTNKRNKERRNCFNDTSRGDSE